MRLPEALDQARERVLAARLEGFRVWTVACPDPLHDPGLYQFQLVTPGDHFRKYEDVLFPIDGVFTSQDVYQAAESLNRLVI